MKVKTFIDRPILSGVISVTILLVGLIGLSQLPLEQYPEIAPPTIAVSTSYTGASASTVQKSVIVPLEEAINGVEDMAYMTSSASNSGSGSVTVTFRDGTDPDMAMVNVQNRVATAQGQLPGEVTKAGITVRRRQPSNLKIIGLCSPDGRYDKNFLDNYMKINIEPQYARIPGIGSADVRGGDYALRIWLDPAKMANYDLMPSDITDVLDDQNIESAAGTIGANSDHTFQYTLMYRGRYENEIDYENLIVKSLPDGSLLRLTDVARIELGANSYSYSGTVNGFPGTTCMISQSSGSNANELIVAIDALSEQIKKDLPDGMELVDIMSVKDFLDASIRSVILTLLETIILVILVVYIFLQNFKSTLIPAVAIVVSLIGTFAALYAIGFTLNLLTLFALVLVIGTVVDDAIVVVEAVQSKFDRGYKSSYLATVEAMGEITSALVTTTIVFMVVFIPVSFLGGTTGTFYRQFGLTMAIAVAISTVNALTMSPALCALIMTPHKDIEEGEKGSFSTRFHQAFDASFNRLVRKYKGAVMRFIKRPMMAIALLGFASASLIYLTQTTKTALVPQEDMGSIFINVTTAPGSSLSETQAVMDIVNERINTIDEIKAYNNIAGFSMMSGQGSTFGIVIIKLKNWDERPDKETQSVNAIVNRIYAMTSDISSARIMVVSPPMISGFGMNNGFEVHIQDKKGGTINELYDHVLEFISALEQRPEVARAQTSFNNKYPLYMMEVDAAACLRNDVSPSDVLSTISGYVGGNYSSNMNRFSKLYRVMVQASPEDYASLESLDKMFVRTSNGDMSPIGQYIKLTKSYGSENLSRFNLFPSISLNGSVTDGYSSGQAIAAIREVAAETLPVGYGFELGGLTREEAQSSGSSTAIIFSICIIFVYLVLCALYESLFVPLAIILSVPFGLAGSFLFARFFGLSNDIYMQTGLIMLIGLLAKTAILLTEFASEKRREGMSITAAAVSASAARLRPILMTSLTMVAGMLPLVFATGVGANGNISLGVGIVGGMLVGTAALLFIDPVFFILLQTMQEKYMPERQLPKLEE